MTDARAKELNQQIHDLVNEWKVGEQAFREAHPDIHIGRKVRRYSQQIGQPSEPVFDPYQDALKAIVDHVMAGTGYDCHISPVVGTTPRLMITKR